MTKPSSVARQGTIAGTQVRSARRTGPTSTGWNQRASAAVAAVGQAGSGSACRMRSGGFHMRGV